MKSNLALLPFVTVMLLAGCASQSPQMASAEKTASLQCQYVLADDGQRTDEQEMPLDSVPSSPPGCR